MITPAEVRVYCDNPNCFKEPASVQIYPDVDTRTQTLNIIRSSARDHGFIFTKDNRCYCRSCYNYCKKNKIFL